ncbi:hypothetical protein AB0M39_11810 [Streptomyces sp. NPDC051907]|uniref:hypothetical protein n=1 Tax=Streptomyces sp. NPDC051907 TaxID=3155284 RepID=UPI00341DF5A3
MRSSPTRQASMDRARMRRRSAVTAVAAVLLLGGCGIQETDVIGAGSPATIQSVVTPGAGMLLFFRSPEGQLSPVIRSEEFFPANEKALGEASSPASTERAIRTLLGGPGKEDTAAGLSTGLPRAAPGGAVQVQLPRGGGVEARLPIALGGLEETARRQLICTIAYAYDINGQTVVQMTGQDGSSATGTCDLAIKAETAPVRTVTRTQNDRPARTG